MQTHMQLYSNSDFSLCCPDAVSARMDIPRWSIHFESPRILCWIQYLRRHAIRPHALQIRAQVLPFEFHHQLRREPPSRLTVPLVLGVVDRLSSSMRHENIFCGETKRKINIRMNQLVEPGARPGWSEWRTAKKEFEFSSNGKIKWSKKYFLFNCFAHNRNGKLLSKKRWKKHLCCSFRVTFQMCVVQRAAN